MVTRYNTVPFFTADRERKAERESQQTTGRGLMRKKEKKRKNKKI